MAYYIPYGQFQRRMTEYYLATGSRLQFPEMVEMLWKRGELSPERPSTVSPKSMFNRMSDEEFEEIINNLVLTLTPSQVLSTEVEEDDIIPKERDVFIIRHPRYTRHLMHSHNYFEINFVATGQCSLFFEKEKHTLKTGELCIIAPNSMHDLQIDDDDTTVFCIMIRKSTFNRSFYSVLSQNDLLAHFFRNMLQGNNSANYLLFYTDNDEWMKTILHNAMGECYKNDTYSNTSCISWITLMFSNLLRNYSKTLQFYNYQMGSDFTLVLQYIQHNYQTLTLSSLAEFFHYSEPHLCTLIKQNTGYNFTNLIKQLKLSDAVTLLTNTNLKINDIALRVGYNSADHFSRVFRSEYKMSPQEYRKMHHTDEDEFIPFSQKE